MEFDPKAIEEKFKLHLQHVDEPVLIVLKGHLLIEEALNSIIAKFVSHPELVDEASLRFPQKVNLARALSLDEHQNEMWALANALNSLRNELAHSLQPNKRKKKRWMQSELSISPKLRRHRPK